MMLRECFPSHKIVHARIVECSLPRFVLVGVTRTNDEAVREVVLREVLLANVDGHLCSSKSGCAENRLKLARTSICCLLVL